MILYFIYKNKKKDIVPETNSKEPARSEPQMKKNGNSNNAILKQPMDGERKTNNTVESSELNV